LGVGCLGEGDAHGAEPSFATDRQIGDHGELLTAFSYIGFDLVLRAPGRFRRDDNHRCVRFPITAGFADFGQGLVHGGTVVVGVEVEVRDAEQVLQLRRVKIMGDFRVEFADFTDGDHRKVPQIAFKPDWTRHAKAAPFKRNDQMLEVLPIGVMVFPGTGIQDNLADKARKLGVPVWRFGSGGA